MIRQRIQVRCPFLNPALPWNVRFCYQIGEDFDPCILLLKAQRVAEWLLAAEPLINCS